MQTLWFVVQGNTVATLWGWVGGQAMAITGPTFCCMLTLHQNFQLLLFFFCERNISLNKAYLEYTHAFVFQHCMFLPSFLCQ